MLRKIKNNNNLSFFDSTPENKIEEKPYISTLKEIIIFEERDDIDRNSISDIFLFIPAFMLQLYLLIFIGMASTSSIGMFFLFTFGVCLMTLLGFEYFQKPFARESEYVDKFSSLWGDSEKRFTFTAKEYLHALIDYYSPQEIAQQLKESSNERVLDKKISSIQLHRNLIHKELKQLYIELKKDINHSS